MMKRTAQIMLFYLSLATCQAGFPIRLGSAGQEYGKCAVTDQDGNIVIGMLFQNTLDFDPGTNTVTIGTPPGIDCAIAKYTPVGELVWAKHISGGTGANNVRLQKAASLTNAFWQDVTGTLGLSTTTEPLSSSPVFYRATVP